jgi:hypothetical protein
MQTVFFTSLILLSSLVSSLAYSGQVVWSFNKKGAFMSNLEPGETAVEGDRICLYENDAPYYCTTIRVVSQNKLIFTVEKTLRNRVKIGHTVKIISADEDLPTITPRENETKAKAKKVPSTRVVQKTKKRIKKKKGKEERRKKKKATGTSYFQK